MNWILLGICVLTSLTFTSCGSVGNGPSVDEPTVQQMSDFDRQWGLSERKVHSRNGANPNDQPIAPEPQPAPARSESSSDSGPASPPPQLVVPSDPVDAGTIKKLQ